MPSSNDTHFVYPYRVVGEHFRRPVYNGQAVVMVDTNNGHQRDAIASLLLELPNIEQLFHPRDIEFIKGAVKRAEQWLANRMKKIEPARPKIKQTPKLTLHINKHFEGYRKRH